MPASAEAPCYRGHSQKNWGQVLNVNTFGTINSPGAVIPYMQAQKNGKNNNRPPKRP
jgi:NADP-dependent 3-hydroxy acid dehydrogenase YdfG